MIYEKIPPKIKHDGFKDSNYISLQKSDKDCGSLFIWYLSGSLKGTTTSNFAVHAFLIET